MNAEFSVGKTSSSMRGALCVLDYVQYTSTGIFSLIGMFNLFTRDS